MVGLTRIGGDVQDNANLSDYPTQSTIVKLATGGFMILWSGTNSGTPTTGEDIRGQAFSSTGAKVGTEFVVNGATAGDQTSMTATLLNDGNVFVTWQDSSGTGGDASGTSIKGQVISATGTRVGSEFLINTTTTDGQYVPAIVTLANGNVMVTWEDGSRTGADSDDSGIRGQVLTAAGVKVGGEFLVNTTTVGSQDAPRMATLTNGNVIILWEDDSQTGGDTSGTAVRAQIVDATGAKVGGEFLVNTSTSGDQQNADVTALTGGGFVVVWDDASNARGDTSGSGINAQIFNGSGSRVGGEFLVNTLTGGDQRDPSVVGLDYGDFVVTWRSTISTVNPAREDIRVQGFSASGVKTGLETVLDAPVPNIREGSPSMVALSDGRFVLAAPSTLANGTSRGVHSQLAAWGHVINGTSGADALVGVAGADDIYVSPGHDTIDGRGGTDRVILNADDHSLFAVTTGSITYTRNGNLLTSSTGTIDTTLTSIEQIEIFDTSAANHTYTDNSASGTRYFHFGSGNDTITFDGTMEADLGLGTNVVNGVAGGFNTQVTLYVDSSAGFATITDNAGGLLVSSANGSTTQLNNVEFTVLRGVAGQGLRLDISATSAANISLGDTPFDDVLIGSSASNGFYSLGSTAVSPTLSPNLTDLSNGNDYKYGNGGADIFDYSVILPTDFGDHIMDLDSDDVLDFSYYQSSTALRLGPNPIFLGTGAFTGVERQIRYDKIGGKTYIQVDLNGDGVADGGVTIENGAFDLALFDDGFGSDNKLKITLAQNFIDGTSGNDVLATGTAGADVIRARDGNDIIRGTSGQDFVDGGKGNDLLTVVLGDAAKFAAPTGARTYAIGADRLFDSSGVLNTSFLGLESIALDTTGTGNFGDTINAQSFGGTTNLTLGNGADTVFGSAQKDFIIGGGGADTLYGYGGDDTFEVELASDVVAGDMIDGGSGFDTLSVNAPTVDLSNMMIVGVERLVSYGDGVSTHPTVSLTAAQFNAFQSFYVNDLVLTTGGALSLAGKSYNPETTNSITLANADTVFDATGVSISGSGLNIIGGTGNDFIVGSVLQDRLAGGAGSDSLVGGGGADTLIGGTGDDAYTVSDPGTVIVEAAGEGADTIKSSVSYVLAEGVEVETMRLLGTGNLNLTGNSGNQTLAGNSGNNVLDSGGGGGRMKGVAGDDTYIVRAANDVVVELAGEGDDTVKAALSYTLGAAAQAEHLWTIDALATTAINLTGNDYSHDIQGNAGINVLTGGSLGDQLTGNGGADTLIGGLGDDTYVISDAATVIVENAGGGTDLVKSTVSYTLAAGVEIEVLRLTGTDNINATGNELAQTLSGNSGNNVLDSGGGGGRMKGVAGDDTYIVRAANDVAVEVAGEGNDTVKAAVSFALNATTDIEHLMTIDALATTAINLTGNDFSHDIQGNAGANVLTGGNGADVLRGFAGNDTLVGGGGGDRFVFDHGTGQDTVGDFVSGADKIDLTAFGFANFAAVQAATHDVGGSAVIDLGSGDTVTLTGVPKAQLQSGDVILSGGGQMPLQLPDAAVQHWMALKELADARHGTAVGHLPEEGRMDSVSLSDHLF